jgi:putative SOS response-associated peptidase YedK
MSATSHRCRAFPDYPAPVIRNTDSGTELAMMRWGMPPPPRTGGPPVTNIRQGVIYEAMTCVTPAEPPESPLALARMFVMR